MSKRALLVGIDRYAHEPLQGCVQDMYAVHDFLIGEGGFADYQCLTLPNEYAHKGAIMQGLDWLVENAEPSEHLLFYFSGHGSQIVTLDADEEIDGRDEVLCAYGFDESDRTAIRDKELARALERLPEGARMLCILDVCHAGGMARGEHRASKAFPLSEHARRLNARGAELGIQLRGFGGGGHARRLVLLAGCEERGSSYEIRLRDKRGGAFTDALLRELRRPGGLTKDLRAVVDAVRAYLDAAGLNQVPGCHLPDELNGAGLLGGVWR
ncbi:caspase domain-containing protein [Sorangium sp. So ce118]